MSTKKPNQNPDNLTYTAEELAYLENVRKCQQAIIAAQEENKVNIPALKPFIERNREKLEKGATLAGNFIRLKYSERFIVEEA